MSLENDIIEMFSHISEAAEMRRKYPEMYETNALYQRKFSLYNDLARVVNESIKKSKSQEYREYPYYNGKNLSEIESRMAEPLNQPSCTPHMAPSGGDEKSIAKRIVKTSGSLDYRSLFYDEPDKPLDYGNFRSASEFFEVVNSGKYDPRLPEKRIVSTGNMASAGVLMPEALVADVFDIGSADAKLKPFCKIWDFGEGDSIRVPMFNSFSKTSDRTVGGFVPVYLGEGDEATPQDPTFQFMELQTKWLTLFTNASLQIALTPNFDRILINAMGEAVNATMEDCNINGNGVGKGTGLLHSDSKVEVSRGTAATIAYTDLVNLYAKIYTKNLANAVWIANPDTLTDLLTLTTPGGTSPAIVVQRPDGVFTIFGKQILFSDLSPTLGETGDIMLCDLSAYNIAVKKQMYIARSEAVEFYKNLVSYRVLVGFDCRSSWVSTVKTKAGVEKSWLAVLK